MSTGLKLDIDQLRRAVQDEYAEVATHPDKGYHFHTGRPLARLLGYDETAVGALPDAAVESFAGVGNPFALGRLREGETVLDLGSGAGFDSILAARQVGPTGRVIGVDMTDAMIEKARANAALVGLSNLEFREGYLEELPVEDASVDVVISNGVINLCPDKVAVWDEVYRVLKPGGRVQIADIIVEKEVPEDAKEAIDLWTGWIAGALLEAETRGLIEGAGLVDVEFSDHRYDTFSGAPSASSAAAFGTKGVNIRARKPKWGSRFNVRS